jgi:hypothetical protein
MISYRTGLAKIGIAPGSSVSYLGFYLKPKSLRQAIAWMEAASQEWSQISEIFLDQFWTDEVQGVGWDGSHWIFAANANQSKPGSNDKAIYVFKHGQPLTDNNWVSILKFKDVPHPIAGMREDEHWGQLCCANGLVYVSQFWSDGSNVVVFKNANGVLELDRWIDLEKVPRSAGAVSEKVEFQAIDPWKGLLYTCFGGGDIQKFFIHEPQADDVGNWHGKFTGRAIEFEVPVRHVQGACFSPDGYLYISSNVKLPGDPRFQTIWYYSVLNGHRMGVIGVLAQESADEDPDDPELDNLAQELEGICFREVTVTGGKAARIEAVLLENPSAALDNIFFKTFQRSRLL